MLSAYFSHFFVCMRLICPYSASIIAIVPDFWPAMPSKPVKENSPDHDIPLPPMQTNVLYKFAKGIQSLFDYWYIERDKRCESLLCNGECV